MRRLLMLTALLLASLPARAELLRVEIRVFGMD